MLRTQHCLWLMGVAASLLWSPAALASSSASVYLPQSGPYAFVAGFRLEVETDWVQGYGCRPVRLELTANKPVAEARAVTIELSLDDYSNRSVVVSTVLELPAGKSTTATWVPVPQLPGNQLLSVRTLVGGREVEELSTRRLSIGNGQYWGGGSDFPRILFVADSPPDVSKFEFLAQQSNLGYGNLSFGNLQGVFGFVQLPPSELFDEPIYYSGLDMIFLSRDDAKRLAASAPRVWQAIRDWTRTGGTLLLYGAQHNDAELAEVERLAEVPATEAEAARPRRGWHGPPWEIYEQGMENALWAARLAVESQSLAWNVPILPGQLAKASTLGESGDGASESDLTVAVDAPFVWRKVGFGYVVAWREPQPFPGDELDWRWFFSSLPPHCRNWAMRHGAAPDDENPQFNELLIADVGLPPIRSYKWLITIFVVLIGPINYWVLRRFERLYLFLFTVPLAALLATGGLLGYALMSDGLQSRLRARSLTVLDQRVEQAASSAWLSYYAGLTPAAGLTFPRTTAITPLELEPAYYLTGNARRRIAWGEQQQLTRGWVVARTPIQLVTQRAYHTSHSLAFGNPQAGGNRKVTNNLGVPVHHLLVCDEDGDLLTAAEIGNGRPSELTECTTEDERTLATIEFLKAFDANAPAVPSELAMAGTAQAWSWFRVRRPRYAESTPFGQEDSAMQTQIKELRVDIAAGALAPRTYVAIVERPAEIGAGLEGLVESQSMHIIFGQW